MYQNGFVAVIMRDGRPVKEIGGITRIPFGTEYKIRLKNKNSVSCKAKVFVDGVPVSTLGDVVISAGGTVDLERFIENSLEEGKRFKFVSVDDPEVQDPTDSNNGKIRVEFYKAKNGPIVISNNDDWVPKWWINDDDDGSSWTNTGTYDGMKVSCYNMSSGGQLKRCKSDRGATVGGGKSRQRFRKVSHFETESSPTVIELELRAPEDNLETRNYHYADGEVRPNYCGNCGKKRRAGDKFCPHCGRKF